jgi:predicted ATPase/class 3 adenylate cyclase
MTRQLPAGTVTFLFTDIEASTHLLQALGTERYAAALATHRWALREAFERNGGVEVDTQGDAFFVAFPTAAAALAAAAEAQTALQELPVRVRIGIHSGEPLLTEEGYVGLDVHRAARIAAVGHGGQTLVSESTHALVDRALLQSLGEHRLKDLTRAEPIYQLGEAEFPPLRSLNTTNLPVASSELVGRRRELAELTALLRDSVRAVTLTGPGGSGKTRLAVQVGAELVDHFPGGVFFVPLAEVADAELVVPALESATGARDLGDLARWKALLVVDNFEHVLDAAPAIADMLSAAPDVRVLATSRAPLRIDGEHEYSVDPLSDADAATLLVERARAVRPGFEPDETVVEICRRLDGLPLALELAASRLRSLGSRALLERLDRRLPLLTGGRRDAPERQQTLRATIEWSHDLLDENLRSAFNRLAVFTGTFSLEAAASVAGVGVEEVGALVEASLLKPVGTDRFLMLETIREFALEQLERAGDEHDLRRLHAEHFFGVAEALGLTTEAIEAGRYRGLAAALEEQPNFRAALDWAASSDPQFGIRLAVALEMLWTQSPLEGWRRFELLLTRAKDLPLELRARALRNIGGASELAGDIDEALRHYERSLELCERLGDEWEIVHLRHRVATAGCQRGDWDRARDLVEENLPRARAGGWRMLETEALSMLGSIEDHDGNPERAVELTRQCLDLTRDLGLEWFEAIALMNLGEFELKLGRQDEAEQHACSALDLARRMDDRQNMVFALVVLALAARARGDDERAGRIWGAIEAESARARIGRWESVYRQEYEQQILQGAGSALERGLEHGRNLSLAAVAAFILDAGGTKSTSLRRAEEPPFRL